MPAKMDMEMLWRLENNVFMETACSADVHSNYPLRRVFFAGKTDFQEVVIAESPTYGQVLFLDGEIQSASTDEAIYHEHLVHPLLSALSGISNKRVLIVGGGEGATAREVLRWPAESVASVDWVDIDGDLVRLCRENLGWADDSVYRNPRLMYYPMDINVFMDRSDTPVYDAIILDLPDPDVDVLRVADAGSDELYGARFRERIMSHLNGAIVTHCGPIRPGADGSVCRPGLAWIVDKLFADMSVYSYHVPIPSFQGTWGFTMTCAPSLNPVFPTGLRVMDADVQRLAFTWPKYWTTL